MFFPSLRISLNTKRQNIQKSLALLAAAIPVTQAVYADSLMYVNRNM